MNRLTVLLDHQATLGWALLTLVLAALVLRAVRPAERRTLHGAWALLGLAALAQAAAWSATPDWTGRAAALGSAAFLLGLAAIQIASVALLRIALAVLRPGTPRIVHDLAVTALSLAWTLAALRLAGVDPSQIFTTSALITAVLAFSLQDTLGNVLGGVALQLDNSLQVGDWVRLDELSGRVSDVRWRYTAIEARNGERVIVPNSTLMKTRFSVIRPAAGAPAAWRRSVSLAVDAEAPPARVIEALERSVRDAQIAHVRADPPASAVLQETAAGFHRYTLRYWLDDPAQDDPTDSQVRIHALASLARSGIGPGVPREERLTIKENDSWRAAGVQREFARRLSAIGKTALFAGLPQEEQRELAGHLVHAPFAAGDLITRQGATAHWLYLIIHGEAEVRLEGASGATRLAVLRDGDFFGEMGMLTGEPRHATVVALSDVDCYRLDKEGFARILQARPEIASEVTTVVQARAAGMGALAPGVAPTPGQGDLLVRIRRFFSLGD